MIFVASQFSQFVRIIFVRFGAKLGVFDSDKNGGPTHVRSWRLYRGLTLAQLAERVGTNANMIGYLEGGDRGLSAKWLRKLAQALDTTPGLLLDQDPRTLDVDIVTFLTKANPLQMRQLANIAQALMTNSEDN